MSQLKPLPRRLIARLDIKGPNLVKGIHLEGLRVIGLPATYSRKYYDQGVDELLFIDIVASLYGRNNLADVVRQTAAEVFVPMTVGGGVRSVEDVYSLLRAGADKVAINTAAINTPSLITEASRLFGCQCIVISIEAQRQPDGRWEAFTDNGRERTGIDAVEWAKRAVDLGAGEVLLTSIDQEGTRKGFDLPLVSALGPILGVPVIACGGAGTVNHLADAFQAGADAVAVASLLHYNLATVGDCKTALAAAGFEVRQ
ncbi:MAG: imidazole glycerol phosphate synthase subunit HisF [Candidatus Sericytochromatia bacterium]|nr:imidazole glycerol phosphate synthase subunit HisF [Candidatus Sericytochromatia bacterium]